MSFMLYVVLMSSYIISLLINKERIFYMKKIHVTRKNLRKKISSFCENKAIPYGNALIAMGIMMSNSLAFADAASSLMEFFVSAICKLILVGGVVFVVLGITNYASANSEGDGPAKNKAKGEIIAGIMLAVLSIYLETQKSTLVSMITS